MLETYYFQEHSSLYSMRIFIYESTLKSGNFEFDVTGLTGKNRNIPEKIKI